jgi:uncharacterized hydrophobic protein (TIGR00271 family)
MKNIITDLFNLHKGEEGKQRTLDNVINNISFKGSNLWILVCAIIVASVGLNVNSTAVIIGAMLISPLMGPIVGSGFALGIYDFFLLRRSLKNLLIATLTGLIVSTIYFYISPFKEVQSEILSRTSPNIYDVLIAFFGGLVGVIAITRVEKGNPIPGVAIATALMPPLCTAGYGLATGNLQYFFGALFLYSINCVFICIATFSIVKYLKYPPSNQININHQKGVKYGISAIIILMLLPSAYFAFSLYKQQQFKQRADTFIEKEFIDNGNRLVYKKTKYSAASKIIELSFLKKTFTEKETELLNLKLNEYGLENTKLLIIPNSENNLLSLKNDILNEVNKKEIVLNEKDKRITELEQELAKNKFDNKQLLSEINVIYPSITSVAVSNQKMATLSDSSSVSTVMLYHSDKELNDDEIIKLINWLKKRLSVQNVEIYQTE